MTCCTPMDYGERARARAEAVDARTPRWCPGCGSRSICFLFWVDVDVMDCADCFSIFSARGD